eukprot:12236764-Ditylum_brightwellii.AAC.1
MSVILLIGLVSVVRCSLDNEAVATNYSLLGLQALFGALPAMGSGMGGNTIPVRVLHAKDELMCISYSDSVGESSTKSAMIVVCSRCTFEQKALVVQ